MKKLFSILAFAVLALSLAPENVNAQGLRYEASALANTNISIANATATNLNLTFDVRRQKSLTLQIVSSNSAATATTFGIRYAFSTDNVNYSSGLTTLNLSLAALASVVTTNIPTYGAGYLRIPYITNYGENTVNFTNVTIVAPLNYNSP